MAPTTTLTKGSAHGAATALAARGRVLRTGSWTGAALAITVFPPGERTAGPVVPGVLRAPPCP